MTTSRVLERSSPWIAAFAAMVGWSGCGGRTPLLSGDENGAWATETNTTIPSPPSPTRPTDGACPDGLSVCGAGAAAGCYDLSRSADHCGQCGQACAPGIACQSGKCQQYRCKGAPSFKTLAAVPTLPTNADYTTVPACAFVPVLGDFDGDGNLDFVGQTGVGAPMGVMLGRGDGTFQGHPLAQGFANTWSAAAADLNGDGRLDLATIAGNEAAVTVRLGSSDSSAMFGAATKYPTPSVPGALVLADLDDDGHPDLVTAQAQHLTLRRGAGDGWLGDGMDLPVGLQALSGPVDAPSSSQYFLRATDWNRDGNLDLLYGTTSLRMLLGRGGGSFDAEIACGLALDIHNPSDNVAADFDHDMKIDLLVGMTLFLGMNGCNFSTSVAPPRTQAEYTPWIYLGVGDMNGDGNADLVFSAWSEGPGGGPIYLLYLGDETGKRAPPLRFPANDTRAPGNILTGDLNHDGKLDIIVTESGGWQVLLNTCS